MNMEGQHLTTVFVFARNGGDNGNYCNNHTFSFRAMQLKILGISAHFYPNILKLQEHQITNVRVRYADEMYAVIQKSIPTADAAGKRCRSSQAAHCPDVEDVRMI
ncbi:hypothetical protein BaRGS_00000588 [Batillaria attramentaria]|uniref:Uncharacterized protein n=1 Tax=Batillaria attramentaria TaxID=370345 RepID=A0ABD0M944_9CAEN